jgi:hypothetical protein
MDGRDSGGHFSYFRELKGRRGNGIYVFSKWWGVNCSPTGRAGVDPIGM